MTVVHCQRDAFDIYVGRPSIYGNPWTHKNGTKAHFKVATAEEAVQCFEDWLEGRRFTDVLQKERAAIIKDYPKLLNKVLACWCAKNAPCHGKVLLKLAQKHCST